MARTFSSGTLISTQAQCPQHQVGEDHQRGSECSRKFWNVLGSMFMGENQTKGPGTLHKHGTQVGGGVDPGTPRRFLCIAHVG